MEEVSIQDALMRLLSLHLGKYSADLCREYCRNRDDATCFEVTRELLVEYMGEQNAMEQLKSIEKRLI